MELPFSPLFYLLWTAFTALWLAGAVAASIVWRRRAGKPIFPKPPAEALYEDTFASGSDYRNLLTKLGGAAGVLQVAVTDCELWTSAKFPYNLMFLPEIFGLEHHISLGPQVRVTGRRGLTGVSFDVRWTSAGEERRLRLRVCDPDDFMAALRRAGARVEPAG